MFVAHVPKFVLLVFTQTSNFTNRTKCLIAVDQKRAHTFKTFKIIFIIKNVLKYQPSVKV